MKRSRLALVSLCLVLAACSSGGDKEPGKPKKEPPQTVELTVTKKGYTAPKAVPGKPVELTLSNETKKPQPAFLARINEGATPAKVLSAFKKSDEAGFRLITPAGSIPAAKPGKTSSLVVKLTPGKYFVLNPDAPIKPAVFNVVPGGPGKVATPKADASMEAGDFFFKLPKQLKAGTLLIHVRNTGKQGHEISFEPKKGKGGAFSIAPPPGGESWENFTLKPGTYTLICHFQDPKTGKSHAKLGMKRTVKVA